MVKKLIYHERWKYVDTSSDSNDYLEIFTNQPEFLDIFSIYNI